jgi:hypothetical protein
MRSHGENLSAMYPAQEESDGYKTSFDAFQSDEGRIIEQIRELEPLAQEEQLRAREAARARLRVTLAALTNQCGLQPVFGPASGDGFWTDASPGSVIKGYINRFSTLNAYKFPSVQTLDELKVTLMLTRSCSIVDTSLGGTAEAVAPPCNEGIDILNAHANDPAFLEKIAAQVTIKDGTGSGGVPDQHYIYDCVNNKVRQFRFPLTVKKYQKAFEGAAERNARISSEKAQRQEEEAEASERSDRRAPRERQERPQKPYDPCRDNGNIRCP